MRSAVTILAVVAAVVAEAPYHLPRPAPHAPSFGYPSGPAPAPLPHARPPPSLPQPRPAPQPFIPFPHPAPAPQQSYPNHGYHYQQPSFGPALVHPPPQPAPQPIPVYHPPPPVHLPAPQPQPLPVSYPQPVQVTYPQPQPQPRPQPIPFPQPSYGIPQPQPQPQQYPQPVPFPQPNYVLPQPQPQPQPLPSYNYNIPQTPVAPQPAPIFPQSQGFAYQSVSQQQFAAPLPLQTQPLTNNAVSSYQADSNQYATAQAQIHGEALDQTVISRVQDIIKDSEHSSAKSAGYLSLVSGVSLESAKPSIEISSFVHNSPQSDAGLIDIRSSSSSASSSSAASSSYNAPSITAGSNQSSSSFGFLPNNKPGASYGVPN